MRQGTFLEEMPVPQLLEHSLHSLLIDYIRLHKRYVLIMITIISLVILVSLFFSIFQLYRIVARANGMHIIPSYKYTLLE